MKLSQTFKADRIPDLFHIMNDISSVMKYPFSRIEKSTGKEIKDVEKAIEKGVGKENNKSKLTKFKEKIRALSVSKISYQHNFRTLSKFLRSSC